MKIKAIPIILLLSLPPSGFSQNCYDILNEFRVMPKSQSLSQLDFRRYEVTLGQVKQIDMFNQQWYSWGSYRVLVSDGRTVKTEGYRPLGIKEFPTINELIYLLRYPVVGPVEPLKRYTWICGGERSSSFLRLTVDAYDNIVSYDGVFCDPINRTDCASFSSESSMTSIRNPQ